MSNVKTREAPQVVEVEQPELPHLKRLNALLEAAPQAVGPSRTELAGQINRALAKMREPGHESEEARLLIRQLDASSFDDLVDTDGVSSRKEAVKTLLSLGFPHALSVDPADLGFARLEQAREPDRQRKAREREVVEALEGPPSGEYRWRRMIALMVATCSSLPLAIYAVTLAPSGATTLAGLALLQMLLAVAPTAYLARVNPPLGRQGPAFLGVVFAAVLAFGLTMAFSPGRPTPSMPLGVLMSFVALLGSLVTLGFLSRSLSLAGTVADHSNWKKLF